MDFGFGTWNRRKVSPHCFFLGGGCRSIFLVLISVHPIKETALNSNCYCCCSVSTSVFFLFVNVFIYNMSIFPILNPQSLDVSPFLSSLPVLFFLSILSYRICKIFFYLSLNFFSHIFFGNIFYIIQYIEYILLVGLITILVRIS